MEGHSITEGAQKLLTYVVPTPLYLLDPEGSIQMSKILRTKTLSANFGE